MSKFKKTILVGVGALALLATGAAIGGGDEPTPEAEPKAQTAQPAPKEKPAPKKVEEELQEEQLENPETMEITAAMVVDVTFADPAAKRQFCEAYNVLGEAGFPTFAESFGEPIENGPTAREVYDESASRC
jgi:hypothetical protein